MNIHAPAVKTVDDFLDWAGTQDGRFEFVRGRIVELVRVSRNHARLASKLLMTLGNRLDLDRYDVGAAEFAVRTRSGVRFPDVFVDRVNANTAGQDLIARELVLAAEILSPSSRTTDLGEKAQEYTEIRTLLHYLVLSQDEPRVWLWSRGDDGTFGKPEMITGADEVLDLSGFEISIPLAELYRGIA
ncbi:Uma2 family endonuclease [Jiella sp. M17.18]|uniref:Uma2 family endonuclease n=1 Tax=Jiella sp. M17.18 TaxID=3234247 RepID=UPI0034DE35EB